MARNFMCDYGDCQEQDFLPVLLTYARTKDSGERLRFCCLEHAALWCKARSERENLRPPARLALEVKD